MAIFAFFSFYVLFSKLSLHIPQGQLNLLNVIMYRGFYICLLIAVCVAHIFTTNSVSVIINGVVMEALMGIDHWFVEETSATAQSSTGLLWSLFKMQDKVYFHE